jgi:hypothetical protein
MSAANVEHVSVHAAADELADSRRAAHATATAPLHVPCPPGEHRRLLVGTKAHTPESIELISWKLELQREESELAMREANAKLASEHRAERRDVVEIEGTVRAKLAAIEADARDALATMMSCDGVIVLREGEATVRREAADAWLAAKASEPRPQVAETPIKVFQRPGTGGPMRPQRPSSSASSFASGADGKALTPRAGRPASSPPRQRPPPEGVGEAAGSLPLSAIFAATRPAAPRPPGPYDDSRRYRDEDEAFGPQFLLGQLA